MKDKKKGKKVPVALVAFCLFAAATVVITVFSGKIFGLNSVFRDNVSENTFVNALYGKIPAVLRTIQIITVAWGVSWLIRFLLTKLLARDNRSTTIIKLINNFLKYLIVIIEIFMILGAWGVDTATLLASAGILSLIIGLGAQSLISDILAGAFIVFEDEFRVGDIVIIDGWRGTVEEIGIRATKIIDWQGNIKIINNSEISTIINQSKELSVTTCVVSVGYGESIPKVELVIKNNLEKIKAAIPEIVEGPYYKGVDKLSASSVDLLFVATVKENDYYVVQRALNREIKNIFDANGITIPFPQITVSYADNGKVSVSEKDVKKADKFVVEQRTVSKNLEDTNS